MLSNARTSCPLCSALKIHPLPVASRLAEVDYFMCEQCLHIWNVPKHADSPIRHISNPRDRQH